MPQHNKLKRKKIMFYKLLLTSLTMGALSVNALAFPAAPGSLRRGLIPPRDGGEPEGELSQLSTLSILS